MSDSVNKATPHNSGTHSDLDATLNSAAAPLGFSAPDLGSIGPYRLIRKLGEGGMGQVWLVEQSSPVKRHVALKIIKAGRYDDSALLRFDVERQTLAIMDHPAIAKVFDAGSTAEGQPYFVMEYVPGLPITQYCDRKRVSAVERLALFTKVCEGVQHAHQKAIMHRDLKPSNILVVEVDGKPMPRIIDFGIAKAISQQSQDETLVTRAGGMVGTPGYMSPEQVDPSVVDVDTRTDVYSLGVVLYELLTGVLPFDVKQWQSKPFHEVLRQLHEEDPTSPSTRISGEPSSTAIAENRNTDPRQLAKLLRGDLDWITLRALEKVRARRYGTPLELAADINRYLRNEPVTARPATVAYRAKKYVQRHKALVVGTVAVVAVLFAGVITSTWQAVRARTAERLAVEQRDLAVAEKRRADAEAAAAKAVNDFLQNDLLAQASATSQSGLSAKPDPDLKVRTALDRAAVRITGKFDQQPEVEAAIRETIGQTYMDLGLYPEARKQVERALDLHRQLLGGENSKTLKTMGRLGRAAELQGKYAEAEALLNQTVQTMRRVLGAENPDTLTAMSNLATVYDDQGKYPQAEVLYGQTLEIRRRILGPEDRATLASMNGLANAYSEQGKYAQAEVLYNQNLEISRRVLGREHPNTLLAMSNLALNYDNEGKFAAAEALFRQTLEIRRHVLGPEHPDTLISMQYLASAYSDQGNYAKAETIFSQTLEIRRRVLGAEHPDTLLSMTNLASTYHSEGKYAQAEALGLQTLEIMRRVLGPEHPDTLWRMNDLANVYSSEGKYAQAEALLRQTLDARRRVLGPEHPNTLFTLSDIASNYQRQSKYALAETYAAQTVAGRRRTSGKEDPDTMAAVADLALAYYSQQKFAESEPLAREVMEGERKKQPDDWQRFRAESLLGASLAGQKKYAEAESLLLEGYRGMVARKDRIAVPDWYHLDRAREWIVELYQAWGRPEKATEWSKQ